MRRYKNAVGHKATKPTWLLILDRSLAIFALWQCVYFTLMGLDIVEPKPITSYFLAASMCWFACRWLWSDL